MSNIVAVEQFKIPGRQELRVANLNCISKRFGQRAQHRFERCEKLMRRFEDRSRESPKLKDQDSDPVAVWLKQVEKLRLQQGCIEEVGVHRARPAAIAWMARKGPDCNLLRHFEGEAQSPRSRRKELAPKAGARELVEGEIAADHRERLRIFCQALALKTLLRETTSNRVALGCVDLPQPSIVLPGAGPEVDPLLCEWGQLLPQATGGGQFGFVEKW